MRISDWSSDVCSSDLDVASFVFKAALRDVSDRQLEEKINEMLQQHQDWVDPEVVMRRIAVEWRRCPHQKLPARVSYMFIKTFQIFRFFGIALDDKSVRWQKIVCAEMKNGRA